MEVLQLSGYSDGEKLEIAKRYLIPDKIRETGLTSTQIEFSEEAIMKLIHRYTREAGLRQLDRRISQICRKVAVRIDRREVQTVKVDDELVGELLGAEKFSLGRARKKLPPGVAVGLAWTPTGGDVLFIEATTLPGGKDVKLTGQLGEVMKESAQAAQSYLWSHAEEFGIDKSKFTRHGLHVHVPEGAIPKDGPSAGITMATALASLYTETSMRADTAMTGELTLSGLVLPIGGLKEKALAAHRSGFKRIIIPKGNEKDLRDLPQKLKQDLEFLLVDSLDEAFRNALKGGRRGLRGTDDHRKVVNM
jgi:ATP-dependent Lon protease